MLGIWNEFDPLQLVILGTGIGLKAEADPALQQGLPKTSALYSQPDPKSTELELEGVGRALEQQQDAAVAKPASPVGDKAAPAAAQATSR